MNDFIDINDISTYPMEFKKNRYNIKSNMYKNK